MSDTTYLVPLVEIVLSCHDKTVFDQTPKTLIDVLLKSLQRREVLSRQAGLTFSSCSR